MNTSNIKRYAPKARNTFIAAMSKMTAKYGITDKAIAPMEIKGDLALIGDRPFPKSIAKAREALVKTVEQHGFSQTIEKVAYSWFNRLCAIRYMELHDYLGHGRRVLSHPTEPTGYQILEECLDIDLAGLNVEKVRELKLDGTKDEQLYRELLLAQCHALHTAMPFLFEAIDDETELLLPENLTKTDSLIHDLVTEIPEEDWQSVEIIGWLYQFYISEKKDQVIGKVVKSEDIPAATQLFTPNWIVKYMVQNSLGAQWLATYPESPLKAEMEYYIEPAEQTDEVNAQLKAITPESLNPEELTLIDPASGSGHILVEAYDLFKAIYLERGYRQRDIAQLILEKNLFGLDIDQRAAQLTGFALMMKGREDDRRLFERGVKLNVMAMVDSTSLDVDTLVHGIELSQVGLTAEDLTALKDLFEHATTFGSLINVPQELAVQLPKLKLLCEYTSQDLFVSETLKLLSLLLKQAELLAMKFDSVVANPPYMGRKKAMNLQVKAYTDRNFTESKGDLFACFIERSYRLTKDIGKSAMVTMQSWMSLSSYKKMRERLLRERTIMTLTQIGFNSFPSMNSKVAKAVVFSLTNSMIKNYLGSYIDLNRAPQAADKSSVFLSKDRTIRFDVSSENFKKISGSPLAFWISPKVFNIFDESKNADKLASSRAGMATGDNDIFTRQWFEVEYQFIKLDSVSLDDALLSSAKWFPYNKGGAYRKWYGNISLTIAYDSNSRAKLQTMGNNCASEDCYFKEAVTWTDLTTGRLAARFLPHGAIFDIAGPCAYPVLDGGHIIALAMLNTNFANDLSGMINSTMHFQPGDFRKLPIPRLISKESIDKIVWSCINFSKKDWDAYERSWDFQSLPIISASSEANYTLENSYNSWINQNLEMISELKFLEEENNRLFNDAYELQNELSPEVPIEQITITVNPAYRYGVKGLEEDRNTRFREDTMEELVSYAIGCMMGRYSLDEPGIIYANSGNEGFDASRYTKFPADDDGIIPLTDKEWFADDAANRLVEFISVAWDANNLEENLDFLAANLSPKKGEGSRDTIRRYLCDKFYKDHMQTYKKRPIYWLFSSGKQKAFQCLVYLHRYNEGTLARMRTEYVIPLTAKLSTHVSKLEKDIEASTSTAEIKKLEKEIAQLHKQQAELSTFDEKLRHFADQRISLDLDDGVKVNYGKFGDLLAEVKAITGETPKGI